MEERPTFTPAAAPVPPSRALLVIGFLAGAIGGLVPSAFALMLAGGLLSGVLGAGRVEVTISVISVLALLGCGIAWRIRRTQTGGFVRGALIGVCVSLLVTGGSVSSLLWMCRKGW